MDLQNWKKDQVNRIADAVHMLESLSKWVRKVLYHLHEPTMGSNPQKELTWIFEAKKFNILPISAI